MDTRAMVGVSPRYGTSAGGLALEKGSWCIDQRGPQKRPCGERGVTINNTPPATSPTTRVAIKPPAKRVHVGSMLGKGRPHAFTSGLRCGWA